MIRVGLASTKKFDDFEPVVEVSVFLAGISNEEVEGAFGEEELVSGMVNFLATEVPEVYAEAVAAGVREVEAENINAFGGFFGGFDYLPL
jgi:hypothetical protein